MIWLPLSHPVHDDQNSDLPHSAYNTYFHLAWNADVFVTVTQADGLGWHRVATLRRETEHCVPTFSTAAVGAILDRRRTQLVRHSARSESYNKAVNSRHMQLGAAPDWWTMATPCAI